VVGDGDGGAAGLSDRAEDEEVAYGARDAESGGVSVRVGPRLRRVLAGLPRPDDRRASGRLDGDHPGALGPDPAEALHLVERLPRAAEAGAAAGRVEDDVGQPPAELLEELVPHRLLPLDAVGLLERREVEPSVRIRAFGDAAGGVGDQAIDQFEAGAERLDLLEDRPR